MNTTTSFETTLPKAKAGQKIIVIALICLLLLLPWYYIRYMITDRSYTRDAAESEVFAKWGGPQLMKGPVVIVPSKNAQVIFPETLDIKSDIATQKLHRGIHDFTVYETTIELSGAFSLPATISSDLANDINKQNCHMELDISSLHGMLDNPAIEIDGQTLSQQEMDYKGSTIKWNVNMSGFTDGRDIHYKITMKLRGSGDLRFVPVGNTTTAALHSNCTTPSFGGKYLPNERSVNADGFEASWRVLSINRSLPQIANYGNWTNANFTDDETTLLVEGGNAYDEFFSVTLKQPVMQYQQNERAVKYAYLIILLTFATVFFIEIRHHKPIHPVQYLLIGVALMLFYTLLLSFSEHLTFLVSYLIASVMTIGLISYYLGAIVRSGKMGLVVAALLTVCYSFIYILLQLENYALLVGSVGIFTILAFIMMVSKKINWYQLGDSTATQTEESEEETPGERF